MSASRLVVLFNAPVEDARHVEHATEAALAMLGRLDPLNQDFEKLFTPGTFIPFNFSIGIETGDALVGELGLKEKGELSAIGPVVDTASLLAERARTYGPAILVGAATQTRIHRGFALLQLDLAVVNGGEPKPFYALMGNPVLRANPRFKALQEGFDAFHGAYRRGKWGQAAALLRQCAKLPGANPRFVALYERRLAFLKEHGTEPGWNGVLRLPIE
jgi:adenylate cyclase